MCISPNIFAQSDEEYFFEEDVPSDTVTSDAANADIYTIISPPTITTVPDSEISFQWNFGNNGPETAYESFFFAVSQEFGVKTSEPLIIATPLPINNMPPECNMNSNRISCYFQSLPSDTHFQLEIPFKLFPNATDWYVYSDSNSDSFDPDIKNNVDQSDIYISEINISSNNDITLTPDLTIGTLASDTWYYTTNKTHIHKPVLDSFQLLDDSVVRTGDSFKYMVSVSNIGTASSSSHFKATFDDVVIYDYDYGAKETSWDCFFDDNIVECELGELNPDDLFQVIIDVIAWPKNNIQPLSSTAIVYPEKKDNLENNDYFGEIKLLSESSPIAMFIEERHPSNAVDLSLDFFIWPLNDNDTIRVPISNATFSMSGGPYDSNLIVNNHADHSVTAKVLIDYAGFSFDPSQVKHNDCIFSTLPTGERKIQCSADISGGGIYGFDLGTFEPDGKGIGYFDLKLISVSHPDRNLSNNYVFSQTLIEDLDYWEKGYKISDILKFYETSGLDQKSQKFVNDPTQKIPVSGKLEKYVRGEPLIVTKISSEHGVSQQAFVLDKSEYDFEISTQNLGEKNFIFVEYDDILLDVYVFEIVDNLVPDWVKNNAKWWADDSIDDQSFLAGIEFLIKERVIVVLDISNPSNSSQQIPDWVKNNARWWSEGNISEGDFLRGIQFLVENGMIKVN
jgi:hypothetical protein